MCDFLVYAQNESAPRESDVHVFTDCLLCYGRTAAVPVGMALKALAHRDQLIFVKGPQTSEMAMGSPSANPHGSEIAGSPARLPAGINPFSPRDFGGGPERPRDPDGRSPSAIVGFVGASSKSTSKNRSWNACCTSERMRMARR